MVEDPFDPKDRPGSALPPLRVVTPASTTRPPADTDATYLDRLLQLMLLNVYGFRGSMSRRVRADVAFAAMLILVQASVDVLAWALGMQLVFVPGMGPWVGFPLAFIFAGLFALTIAIFERSVLTADVDVHGALRSPAVLFRVGFVLLASLVTAVPLELYLFHDEVGGVIGRERGAKVAMARDVLRKDVDAAVAQSEQTLDQELHRLTNQFATLREYAPPTQSSVTPRMATLEAQLERVTAQMQAEDEGVRSGRSGRGHRYRSLMGQLELLERQREALTVTHNAELVELRAEARKRAEAGEVAHREAVTALRAAHEKERTELRARYREIDELPVATLAARAKVSLNVPDGFAARVRILHGLAEEQVTVESGIWALRLVMVLFGLLVIIQKVTFSTETRAYFSAMAHAAQGDQRLRRMFGALVHIQDLPRGKEDAVRSLAPPRDPDVN